MCLKINFIDLRKWNFGLSICILEFLLCLFCSLCIKYRVLICIKKYFKITVNPGDIRLFSRMCKDGFLKIYFFIKIVGVVFVDASSVSLLNPLSPNYSKPGIHKNKRSDWSLSKALSYFINVNLMWKTNNCSVMATVAYMAPFFN